MGRRRLYGQNVSGTLGATAFALFGSYERTPETWQLEKELFEIAKRAVSKERDDRQQSVREFQDEWNGGCAARGAKFYSCAADVLQTRKG